jgi:hypothetical protein
MKQYLREVNCKYLIYLGRKSHLVLNIFTGKEEFFVSNKNYASWGLIWKNTHLEFVASNRNFEKIYKRQKGK